MNTIRFSQWLQQVEDKLKMEFDFEGIDQAYKYYGEGWSVDDFAFEVMDSLEVNTDYALGRGH